MHGDVYYPVEDGEDGGCASRVWVVNREALFVLEVGVPEGVGEEVLAHGCCATFKESRE